MKPENHDEEEIRAALKRAFAEPDTELRRDLWSSMLQRLETPRITVPWYDWALAACVVAVVILFPKFILFFAYHL
ncbi:MAG TPA: hypothetical protein VKD65_03045 [Candidatus Angelobacter sp.]|nr:hypothetical protein [Candidatus Angelobacter sp.]HKE30675.1 hypothetical protein [Candidatus Angelobacter sp.]